MTLIKDHAWTDVIWISTGFLGDLILNTAAFEVLASHLPRVRQHVVTTPLGVTALAGARSIVSLIPFEKRGHSTIQAFKKVRNQVRERLAADAQPLTLQVHRSLRSSLLGRWLGFPSITYVEAIGGGYSVHRIPRVAPLHESARIALLLEPLGIPRGELVAARPHLEPLPLKEDIPWQRRIGVWQADKVPIIAVAPGSVWGTKRWPKDKFVELIQLILSQTSSGILLLGSQAEKNLCGEIEVAVGSHNQRLIDLSGATSLDDLRRVYPALSALVSNDSSPLHYGSAFNIPSVGIFGATIPEMGFGPLSSRSFAVGVSIDCRPCSDHGPQTCPLEHFRCMRELTPSIVFSHVLELLKEGNSSF